MNNSYLEPKMQTEASVVFFESIVYRFWVKEFASQSNSRLEQAQTRASVVRFGLILRWSVYREVELWKEFNFNNPFSIRPDMKSGHSKWLMLKQFNFSCLFLIK